MLLTVCCFCLVLLFIGAMVKAGNLFDKNEKEIYRCVAVFFGIFAIIMMFVMLIGFGTSDFYTDVKETDTIIVDKWIENGRYYFACEHGNVYQLHYGWTIGAKYNNTLYNRHKSLVVNKEYTLVYFYSALGTRRNSLSEIRKDVD